jgi:hypothetical protein
MNHEEQLKIYRALKASLKSASDCLILMKAVKPKTAKAKNRKEMYVNNISCFVESIDEIMQLDEHLVYAPISISKLKIV